MYDLVKVLLWRLISIMATLLLTFILTGNLIEATQFTFILHSVLVILHFIFEKIWNNRFISIMEYNDRENT